MENTHQPSAHLAKRSLPKPLLLALNHIFAQNLKGCALVGGTALAGFYAGHRRSDDLDLFTKDEASFKATVLAVKTLPSIGVRFLETSVETGQYFRVIAELSNHRFTVDVVLDSNLFRVGTFVTLESGVQVASLQTLLKTKAATLVSRCSEKDLYDLLWLFREFSDLDLRSLIQLGAEIDAGVTAENILISLGGAILKVEACDFSLSKAISAKAIHAELLKFRKEMIIELQNYLKSMPAPPLKELVRRIGKLR
jgi:hypothetical protein